MEFPLEIQALINLFAKPITSGKWREGSFIIDSFRAAAAEYIEQRYEYDVLNQFRQQLHGLSYDTYSQLPFYEWLALSHVSCRDQGIPRWAIYEFCEEKMGEARAAERAAEVAVTAAEAARAVAVAAFAAEAVRIAERAGGTQEEMVSAVITTTETVVHIAGDPFSQEDLDELVEEIAVEAKRILKSFLSIPGPLVRQTATEVLEDGYDSDGLEDVCISLQDDENCLPEPLVTYSFMYG